jgi:hypothetical protein
MMRVFSSTALVLILIFLLAFGLRIWGIDFGLPYTQLTDETSDLATSLRIASGETPRYTYHRVFWPLTQLPFHGAHFLYRNVTESDFSLADFEARYYTNRADFLLTARLVGAFMAAVAVFPAYFMGHRLTQSRLGGVLTAVLLAVYPTHTYMAHTALPDAYATLWITLTLLACVAIATNGVRWAYILAGAGAALAMLARLQTLMIITPVVVAHFIYWWQQPGRTLNLLLTRWWWAVLAFVLATIIANPFTLLKPDLVAADIRFIFEERYQGTYYEASNAFVDASTGLNNVRSNALLPVVLMRPYFLIAVLLGAAVMLWQRLYRGLPVLFFWLIFTLSLLPTAGPRLTYWLPSVIPTLVLAGYLLTVLLQQTSTWRRGTGLLASVLIIGLAFLETVTINRILANQETRMLAYEFVTEEIEPGTKILAGQPFTFAVPLHRSEESIQRLAAIDGDLPPSYAFQLENPSEITQPLYDLFGPEYQPDITSDTDWWQFVDDNAIEYVIEADYCGGEPRYGATSSIEFPPITAAVRAELELVTVISPFDSDVCQQIIPDRTALENMNLNGWVRVGPVIRIYKVKL